MMLSRLLAYLESGKINSSNPAIFSIYITLLLIFVHVLAVISFFMDESTFHVRNEFYFELFVSWLCYTQYFRLTVFGDRRSQGNMNMILGGYISIICILLTITSFFLRNERSLLLARFVSWIFTFPAIALVQFNTLNYSAKKKAISHFFSAEIGYLSMFCLLIIQFAVPSVLGNITLWCVTCICFYYQSLIPENLNMHALMLIYGVVWAFYQIDFVIDDKILCKIFILLDLLAKFLYVYFLCISKLPILSADLESQRMALFLAPSLESARKRGVINDETVYNLRQTLGYGAGASQFLSHEIISELFPLGQPIAGVQSESFTNIKYHNKSCVMFIDMVNFSGAVMKTELNDMVFQLQNFYITMDLISEKFQVQKIEIIGDCFLIRGDKISETLRCASAIISEFGETIRIGIDVGDVIECALGLRKMRQSIVGHTVNVASRLESTGVPGQVHVSQNIVDLFIEENQGSMRSSFKKRKDIVHLKGIGEQQTYFWIGNLF